MRPTPVAIFPSRRAGASLAQLLVSIGIILLLAAVLLPTAARVRAKSKALHCVGQLRTIASAFTNYASDNGGKLPYPALTEIPWERSLLRYVSADVFVCPGDQELAPATGSSYDWRDTGIAATTLAGENPMTCRGEAVLAFDALPSWHEAKQTNVVRADGSAASMSTDALVADLMRPVKPP